MLTKVYIDGLREVETKSGKNAGQKTLFFTVLFQFHSEEKEHYFAATGFRLINQKICPPATRLGLGFMNLNYFDRTLCMEIAKKLKIALEEKKLPYTLLEPLEQAIKTCVLKRSDLKRLCPELEINNA